MQGANDDHERIIRHVELTLDQYDRESRLEEWFDARYRLGTAYLFRFAEPRMEDVRHSIDYLTEAVEVFIPPHDGGLSPAVALYSDAPDRDIRGVTFYLLGLAHDAMAALLRISRTPSGRKVTSATQLLDLEMAGYTPPDEERQGHIAAAIIYFIEALRTLNRDNGAEAWVDCHYHLGVAFDESRSGARAANLSRAEGHLKTAVSAYAPCGATTDEDLWAEANAHLARVYLAMVENGGAERYADGIACCDAALQIYSYKRTPDNWAAVHVVAGRLGLHQAQYRDAAAHFEQALTVFTAEHTIDRHIDVLSSLSGAYVALTAAEPHSYDDKAIACLEELLRLQEGVTTAEEQAYIHLSLGTKYRTRHAGEVADNVEHAIHHLERAAHSLPHDTPDGKRHWSAAQNDLGIAHAVRLHGEPARNQERALRCFTAALKARTPDTVEHAQTLSNMTIVLSELLDGDRAANMEQAIVAGLAALDIYTRKGHPVDRAMAQNILATAYRRRLMGNLEANVEKAIACLTEAEALVAKEDYSELWAMTQTHLSNAHQQRSGDKRTNLEQALGHSRRALEVYREFTHPEEWSKASHNMAMDCAALVGLGYEEYTVDAIARFKDAVRGHSQLARYIDAAHSASSLGDLFYKARRWEEAAAAFAEAVRLAETHRADYLTHEGKADLALRLTGLYEDLFDCYIRLDQVEQTIEVLEQSKARNLADLLAERAAQPRVPEELLATYNSLSGILRATSTASALAKVGQVDGSSRADTQRRPEERTRLYDQLETVYAQIQAYDPAFLPSAAPLKYDNLITALPVPPDTAVVLFALHEDSAHAIVLRPNHLPGRIVPLPHLDRSWLRARLYGDETATQPGVLRRYWLHADDLDGWAQDLDTLLGELGERVIAPLRDILGDADIRRLLFIPHRELHLLPLHACWTMGITGQRRYVIDDVAVGYAPSMTVLARAQRHALPTRPRILAVLNPDGSLPFAAHDLDGIPSACAHVAPLVATEATQQRMLALLTNGDYEIVHIASHGIHNLLNPLASSIELHDGEHITLADLYGVPRERKSPTSTGAASHVDEVNSGTLAAVGHVRVELQQALVTLSACETALSETQRPTDEYEGLPAGLLSAGASSVIGTLWRVGDLATAILMQSFYHALLDRMRAGKPMSIAEALREAQLRVRDLTVQQLRDEWLHDANLSDDDRIAILQWLRSLGKEETESPFADVRWWGAACAIGAVL